jgi:maltose alpha-D-glucosyltransferase/alpha-amylase
MRAADAARLALELHARAEGAFERLKQRLPLLSDEVVEVGGLALGQRRRVLDRLRELEARDLGGQRIRIHGNLHLAQALAVRNDFFFANFEGKPAAPVAERRRKASPLEDVAGMLHSFDEAAWVALLRYAARRPEGVALLEPWAELWRRAATAAFLRTYREEAEAAPFLPPDRDNFAALLDALLVDAMLAAVVYELDHRPERIAVPLRMIVAHVG